ncbi:flagellar basal body L-ring protein FlgH [Pelomicrobium sp.]|uniref:flagellar basal body L-ring protein FlgH n=1 Tax=Pelomicrobium sp. TaxID=2815319 RepID=UPI002FDDE892
MNDEGQPVQRGWALKVRWGVIAGVALALLGCAAPAPIVHQPMSARPLPQAAPPPGNGAIYRVTDSGPGFGPGGLLFEDQVARAVGDTLTIVLNEKTIAAKNRASSASKSGSVDFGVPLVQGLPFKSLQGAGFQADSTNTFQGKGAASADNMVSGTLTVTVIEVLPNGNLLVSGEKQLALSQGEEYVRFSGVVNPNTITPANTVSSTQVADARIEYRGRGTIDEAQVMGWLGRFFLTVLPF